MNYTKSEILQSIEQTMRTLKLSGLAKEWRSVVYHDSDQYMRDLLEIEVREREANRMTRMVKQAGFRVIKTLDNFVWKPTIEIPATITREEIESAAFVKEKENLVLMGTVGTGKTHLATAIAVKVSTETPSPVKTRHTEITENISPPKTRKQYYKKNCKKSMK